MKLCDGVYAYIWRGVFENNCNMYYFGEPLNLLFDPGLARHLDLRFCLLYTSPSPRDRTRSRMPSSA